MSYDVTRTDRIGTDDLAPELEHVLEHVTVTCADGEDECAIFPRETADEELPGCWISAQGESFVDLEAMC
ncbi:DUF7511 domain-containing protein [Natrialbaceae archaeon A-gly3]